MGKGTGEAGKETGKETGDGTGETVEAVGAAGRGADASSKPARAGRAEADPD
jgi:hypothetical protein